MWINKFARKALVLLGSVSVLVLAWCLIVFAQAPAKKAVYQRKFTYDSQGKRNPFAPLLTPEGRLLKIDDKKESQAMTLEGIIFDPHGISYAMVNGEVLKIGESFQGFQVLKIEENRVIFVKDSQLSELELTKEGE